jgi:hypothetical protein
MEKSKLSVRKTSECEWTYEGMGSSWNEMTDVLFAREATAAALGSTVYVRHDHVPIHVRVCERAIRMDEGVLVNGEGRQRVQVRQRVGVEGERQLRGWIRLVGIRVK